MNTCAVPARAGQRHAWPHPHTAPQLAPVEPSKTNHQSYIHVYIEQSYLREGGIGEDGFD